MVINEFIKFKGERLPIVNTPVSKDDYIYLTDNYGKFLLRDYKQNKVYPVFNNRINHSFSFNLGERGLFNIGGAVIGLLLLYSVKRKTEKIMSKYNPFHMPNDLEEYLDNLENKTPKEDVYN